MLRKGGKEVRGVGGAKQGAGRGVLGTKGGGLFGTRCGDNWLPAWEKNGVLLPYFLYQNKFQVI